MTAVPGLVHTPLQRWADGRGNLVKVFQASALSADPGREVFLSTSARGVVRGLHFQVPPHDHAKTVVCLAGSIVDVAVDLRRGSPTEGQVASFQLDGGSPSQLHLPSGLAHGFQALEDDTLVAYVVSSEHAPDHDRGIRWDSIGFDWPLPVSAMSDRDQAFPGLDDFDSPFTYAEPEAIRPTDGTYDLD